MIFGFPQLKVPFTNPKFLITRQWYRALVQMGNVLGTINYGVAKGVVHGTSVTVLTMLPGQSAHVHAFSMSSSANNASADAFYDGTTLTLSNLITNGTGVTLASAGPNIQISNSAVAGTIDISWRAS